MTKSKPRIPRFDLIDLRLFVAIVRAGSLSGGANGLRLAISAASARLKNLEQRLDARLFERHPSGVTLTNAGRLFYEFALRVTKAAQDTQSAMDALSGDGGIRLTVLGNAMAVGTNLPQDLGKFLRTSPKISVELGQMTSKAIVQAVSTGNADLGIIDSAIDSAGLSIWPYLRNQLLVVAPKEHPLVERKMSTFSEVMEYPLVGLDERNPIQKFLSDIAILAHMPTKQRAIAPTLNSVVRLVAEGAGVAILPEVMASQYSSQFDLKFVPLDEPWATRELQICIRSGLPKTAQAQQLASFLSLENLHSTFELHPRSVR